MRLLSFCNLVETAMDMIQPVHAKGWNRRAIYQLGNATYWNPKLGLTLTLACCSLEDGCCSIQTCWHGPSGEVLQTRVFSAEPPNSNGNAPPRLSRKSCQTPPASPPLRLAIRSRK